MLAGHCGDHTGERMADDEPTGPGGDARESRPGLRARLAQWSVTRWLIAISSVAALAAIGLAALLLAFRPRFGCGGVRVSCGGVPPSSPQPPSGDEAPDTGSNGSGGCDAGSVDCRDVGGCDTREACDTGGGCGSADGCGDSGSGCGGGGSGCGDSGSGCGGGGSGCGSGGGGGGCGSGGGGGGCGSGGGGGDCGGSGGGDCSGYLTSAPPHADLLAGLPMVLRSAARPSRPARLGVLAIRAYQRWLSPRLGARCRYTPTCSQYARQAIQQYGLVAGAQLATARIRRCTAHVPRGAADPVPGSVG